MDTFQELLAGAASMDQHFKAAQLADNIPVQLALQDIWNINFGGRTHLPVLIYSDALALLPAYLQQLIMESNGKSVTRQGDAITYQTAPIVWGGVGCNGQHAYCQLLLQGTRPAAVDFIAYLDPNSPYPEQQASLYANCLAQSQAFMRGLSVQEVARSLEIQGLSMANIENLASHKVIHANNPSNTFVLRDMTARSLGALIALYEHRTFVQAAIWDINPFDQYGVELGKGIANDIVSALHQNNEMMAAYSADASTAGLLAYYKAER